MSAPDRRGADDSDPLTRAQLGLEHGDGVMTPALKPGQTVTPTDTTTTSSTSTGAPDAIFSNLPAGGLLLTIQSTLIQYFNGALSGTQTIGGSSTNYNLGGVASLTGVTLTATCSV